MTAITGDGRLDHISKKNFQRLAQFIEESCGIKMPSSKITMVEGRLRRRVRATGLATLSEYCSYLFDDGGLEAETIELINAITTNKTDFFREPEHFRYLAEHAVPQLMSGGAMKGRPLKAWSAACSIGAEAYTLAMVLAGLEQRHGLRSSIFATDICTDVLKTAVLGIYPEAMIAPVPADMRRSYVMRARDCASQTVRITPELRAMVSFGRINLMEAPYQMDREMDVIFCRNILIYFDKANQERVLQRLSDHLRPGGYMFLGHSETIGGFNLPLEAVDATVFRRR